MNDTEEKNSPKKEETTESIIKTGSVSLGTGKNTVYCMTVIGQIEGHYSLGENQKATKYEHILPLLVSVEENEDISGLLILLNTMGGDVEAGLAIAEMISSMEKPTASIVLGGGHSIGVPLAVAAKKSFIVPSATMTLHPVRTQGLVLAVPQAFRYLEEMQERIIRFIKNHSNADEVDLRERMHRTDVLANDIGSVVSGEEAVKMGLIDEVGGIKEAMEYLRRENRKRKQE